MSGLFESGEMSEKSRAADETPSSIGRYEITGALGFGAMGAVYRAFDPIIKRPLAIKTIRLDVPRQSPQHKAFIERFYQEARISGTLSHPNIVTLFDIGEESGVPFLAMEYVEGQTIAELLESGVRFKPENVISLASQIATGLDYAHSRGVVHRDVKPSNLIVQAGDKVKVTDFGIAKLVDSEITQSGTLLGTPSYMSPEQAMGEQLDGRSDIFSLGVCAFEMLSGQQPFPGTNVTSILYKLVHVDPVEPADLEMNGLVPQKWREVFHKVLAKKPEGRYQTASEFVRDLEYCLGSWFTGLGDDVGPLATADESTVTLSTVPRPAALGESSNGDAAPDAAAEARPAHTGGEARAGNESETVILPAPSEVAEPGPEDPTTLLPAGGAAAPPGATETLALPPPGPLEALVSGPTVALDAPTVGTLPPSPVPAEDAGAPPRGRPLPAGRILAAAAGLFVFAVAVVGWMLWPRGAVPRVEVATPPETLVAESPLPFPLFGTLRVVSEPEGARVTLDGDVRGRTPLDLAEIPFGAHQVRIELKGYEGQDHDVALSADRPVAELQATLSRRGPTLGRASFTSTPAGGEVSVDGKSVGATPVEGVRLRPGRHRVEITLDGHETWSGTREGGGRRSGQRRGEPGAHGAPRPSNPAAGGHREGVREQGRAGGPGGEEAVRQLPLLPIRPGPAPEVGGEGLGHVELPRDGVRRGAGPGGDGVGGQGPRRRRDLGREGVEVRARVDPGHPGQGARPLQADLPRRLETKVARLIINPTAANRRELALSRDGILTIGRDPSNDLVLPDAMVSRRHAVIEQRGNQFFLRDCSSANGSVVNGDRVSERGLRDGDLVAIGSMRLLFREDPAEPGAKVVPHPSAAPMHCPDCGADYRRGDVFCRECGGQVAQPNGPPKAVCSSCGTAVSLPARFCNACGDSLGADVPGADGAKTDTGQDGGAPGGDGDTRPLRLPGREHPTAHPVSAARAPVASAPQARPFSPGRPRVAAPGDKTMRPTPPPVRRSAPLRASPPPRRGLPPATPEGFGRRFAAGLVDAVFVLSGQVVMLAPVAYYWWSHELPPLSDDVPLYPILATVALVTLAALLGGLYHVYSWGVRGTSPGKELLELRVEAEDGACPIGLDRAGLRLLGYLLSAASLGIGFLMIASGGRGLHDRIAGTRVVRRMRP